MEFLINADIKAIPAPLPDTIKISTNSRLRLKYCATINVEQSRVIPVVDERELVNCFYKWPILFPTNANPDDYSVAEEKLMEL